MLGFDLRYARVHDQLRLLLNVGALGDWNRKHHGGKLALCDLVAEQYPLVIFHGDVGTGKTAMAECIANRLVAEARSSDSILFKLSNRVRGNGMVGEMGTLIAEAFRKVTQSAGKTRRAILIIDEGDSLAASRAQDHSHHEDKVAVNTLIQGIDDFGNTADGSSSSSAPIACRFSTRLFAGAQPSPRTFRRPRDAERQQLFGMDLGGSWTYAAATRRVDEIDRRAGPPSGLDILRYPNTTISRRTREGLS